MACPPSGRSPTVHRCGRACKAQFAASGKATDKGVVRRLLGGVRRLDAGGPLRSRIRKRLSALPRQATRELNRQGPITADQAQKLRAELDRRLPPASGKSFPAR